MRVEFLIVSLVELFRIDPQIFQDSLCHIAVLRRAFDRLGAAVADEKVIADAKFVALGVSAEVVVIVEDENAGTSAGRLR